MTCTPERIRSASTACAATRVLCRPLALALAAALLGSAIAAPSAASPQAAAELIAKAQEDLAKGDGIAAEARLDQAIEQGAARDAVAAYMGQALLTQNQPDRARVWLAPGAFTPETAAIGFRTLAALEQMQGDLAAAGAAFDRVIGMTPNDATMWVDIARLRYAGGEHMLALDAANYAYDLDPEDVRVLELRGQIVRDQFGLAASLPWLEAALAGSPDDASVLGEYAATLGDLGRTKEMLAVTRKLMKVDPGNPRGLYLQAVLAARAGDFTLARRLMNRVGDKLDAMPSAMLLEGVLELEAGNYVLASEAFERLVQRQPANDRARALLVRALFQSGEYRQLVTRFADAAAGPYASPYLMTVVARAYEALGERRAAAPLLDRAALANASSGRDMLVESHAGAANDAGAEEPGDPASGNFDAQLRAGDIRLAGGNGVEALDRYRLAARVRMPEGLMLRMVAAYRLIGRNDDAAALIERYLAQSPRSEAAGRLAAKLAADAGDWKRAVLLLENLKANGGGRDVRLLSDLSLAQLRVGDAAAAEIRARDASRVQRSSPLAAQALGLSLAARGQQRRAATSLLDKALQLLGDNALQAEGRQRLAGRRGG